MGAVTPETCRVVLQWINICILLHLLDFYPHWTNTVIYLAVWTVHLVECYYICGTNAQYIFTISVSHSTATCFISEESRVMYAKVTKLIKSQFLSIVLHIYSHQPHSNVLRTVKKNKHFNNCKQTDTIFDILIFLIYSLFLRTTCIKVSMLLICIFRSTK